jgi:hypothetical protein
VRGGGNAASRAEEPEREEREQQEQPPWPLVIDCSVKKKTAAIRSRRR